MLPHAAGDSVTGHREAESGLPSQRDPITERYAPADFKGGLKDEPLQVSSHRRGI
jgi:hypothetical protein